MKWKSREGEIWLIKPWLPHCCEQVANVLSNRHGDLKKSHLTDKGDNSPVKVEKEKKRGYSKQDNCIWLLNSIFMARDSLLYEGALMKDIGGVRLMQYKLYRVAMFLSPSQ